MVGRRTIGGTCSRAITKDWRRLIVRSIVGNRATSRGDQQLIVRSIVATYDRSYHQSWRPATSRTIDRRSSSSRYKNAVVENDLNSRNRPNIYTDLGELKTGGTTDRKVVQPVVTGRDWSYYQSWGRTTGGTTNRQAARPVTRPIVRLIDPRSCTTGGATIHDWWYDHVRPLCDLLRFGIAGQKFWTWPSTLLRLILLWRSPTTSATSRTFSLRFTHDSNPFRS